MQRSFRQTLRLGSIIVVVILAVWYIYTQFGAFLSGPSITFSEPPRSSVTTEQNIAIAGTAQNVTMLTINGNDTSIDQQGVFKRQLLLLPGYNIIEVQATDRFERSRTWTRTVIFNAPVTPTTPATSTATTTP